MTVLKKRLLNFIFLALIFVLTLWSVFYGEDFHSVLKYISEVKFRYIAGSIVCVIGFIFGESVVICYLLRTLGIRTPFFHCCLYSFIGFFYSCITPSASGGQPMQVVAMKKDQISVPVATVVLAIVTITYKLVLVFLGILVMIWRPFRVMMYLEPVESIIYLGLILNVICIGLLLLLVFHPHFVHTAAMNLLLFFDRIRPLKNKEEKIERLEHLAEQYHGTAEFYKSHKSVVIKVFLITVLQRFLLFFVTWLTYLAFELSSESMPVIVALQGMISVAVDMLPLPGGMGISENLFLIMFQPIFGEEMILPAMVISRGISYYTQLLISAVMTVAAFFILNKACKRMFFQLPEKKRREIPE